MEYGFSRDIKNTMSTFSNTVENLLYEIEKNNTTDKAKLKEIFDRELLHFFVKNDENDATSHPRLLTAKNFELVTYNTEVSKERQFAALFNLIHIEPILAMAEHYKEAGMNYETELIMSAYNFALGMRRLYRKLI